jgi:hypothetical protein
MNFGMNGFQQWNETGYPHCKVSAIGQEIPKRIDKVQEIQDYSNVIELTLKTKRSRTVFGFEGTLFFWSKKAHSARGVQKARKMNLHDQII